MHAQNKHNKELIKKFESEEYLSQFNLDEKDVKDFFAKLEAETNNSIPLSEKFLQEEYIQQFQATEKDWYIFENLYLNKNTFITKNILLDLLALLIFLNFIPNLYLNNISSNISNSKIAAINPKPNFISNNNTTNHNNNTSLNSKNTYSPNNFKDTHLNNPNNNTHSNTIAKPPTTHPANNKINILSTPPNLSQPHISNSQKITQKSFTSQPNNNFPNIHQSNSINNLLNHHENQYNQNSSSSLDTSESTLPTKHINYTFLSTNKDTNTPLLHIKNIDLPYSRTITHFLCFNLGYVYNFGYSNSNGKGFTPTIGINYSNNFIKTNILLGTGIHYTAINHLNTLLPTAISEKYDFGYSKDTTYLQYTQLHYLLLPIHLAYLSKFGIFSTAINIKYLLYSNTNFINKKISPFDKQEISTHANNYITGLNQWNYGFSISYQNYIYKNIGLQLTYYQDLQTQQKNNYPFSSALNKNKFISLTLFYDIIRKK